MSNYILQISGAGNRFLLADKNNFMVKSLPEEWQLYSCKIKNSFEEFLQLKKLNILNRKAFIKNLISLPKLFLTDGLVVLNRKKNSSFYCDFYNKDGSTAEMCGNASCCISMYAEWRSIPLKNFVLGKTKISCVKKGGIIFKPACSVILDFNEDIKFSFINTGAPHGVIECSNCLNFSDKTKLKTIAKKLRFRNINKQKGMNISFYKVIQQNHLKAISYERGVENWTLSCGTGALASALVYLHKHSIKNINTVFIEMPGGTIKIRIKPNLTLFSPVKKGF